MRTFSASRGGRVTGVCDSVDKPVVRRGSIRSIHFRSVRFGSVRFGLVWFGFGSEQTLRVARRDKDSRQTRSNSVEGREGAGGSEGTQPGPVLIFGMERRSPAVQSACDTNQSPPIVCLATRRHGLHRGWKSHLIFLGPIFPFFSAIYLQCLTRTFTFVSD